MTERQQVWHPQLLRLFNLLAPQPLSNWILVEMGLIIVIGFLFSFLLSPDSSAGTWTGATGALVSVLAAEAAPVSVFGALLIPFRLSFRVLLCFWIVAICLFVNAIALALWADDTESEIFFTCVFLTAAFVFFAVLRDARFRVLEHYGPVSASLASIALILLIPGLSGVYLLTQVLLGESEDAFPMAFGLTQATFVAFVIYLWHKVHTSSYRRFPRQVTVVAEELVDDAQAKYPSLFVNSTLCRSLLSQSHLYLSLSLLFVVLLLEIYLGTLLYAEWKDTMKAALLIFLQTGIPATLFLGSIYTSAEYRKDEKLLLIVLISFPMFFVAVIVSDSLADVEDTQELGYLIKYSVPGSLFYWMCILYIYHHNKECYQLVTPLFCYAVFIPLLVIYPLYTQDLMTISMVAVLVSLSQLLAVFLFISFWFAEACATLSAYCHLFWIRLKNLHSDDFVQFLYMTVWFGVSFLLVNQWQDSDDEGDQAMLIILVILLQIALIVSLVLQQVSLWPKNEESVTLTELMLGLASHISADPKLKKKKNWFQAAVWVAMAVHSLIVGLCMVLYSDSAYESYPFSSLLIGGLTILIIGVIGFEAKYKLKSFGQRWISNLLLMLWLFLVLPLFGLTPLLHSLGVEPETLLLFTTCVVFLLILVSITAASILLNTLFIVLESEKLMKYCISHLVLYLNSVAVTASQEIMRSVITQFKKMGSQKLTALMQSKDYVREFVLDDSEVYQKAILPAKEGKVKEGKRLSKRLKMEKKNARGAEKSFFKKVFGNCCNSQEEPEEERFSERPLDKSQSSFKDISMVYEPESKEEMLALSLPVQPPDSSSDEEESKREESCTGLQDLQEYFHTINESDSLKTAWFEHLFHFVARGEASNSRFLTQFDLREFVTLIEIARFVKPHRCDLIYVILTTEFSPAMTKKSHKRIDFEVFYKRLLPELAKEVCPGRPSHVQLQFLFENYLYPNLTSKVPEIEIVTRELGKAANPLVEEPNSDKVSQAKPVLLQKSHSSVCSSSQEPAPEASVKSAASSLSSSELSPRGLACCYKVSQRLSRSWHTLMAFFTLVPQETTDIEEVAVARVASPEWEELCETIPDLLERVSKQWTDDRHTYKIKSLKCTFANLLGVVSHSLEIVSYCLVAFNPAIRWLDWLHPAEEANSKGLEQTGIWVTSFGVGVGVSILFMLIVFPVKRLTQEGRLGLNKDYTEAKFPSLQFFLVKLFTLFSTTLYLFVIKAILSVFNCQPDSDEWVLVKDNSVLCFEGIHWLYICLGMIAFLLYYPAATIMYPIAMFQNRSLDLKFASSFLIAESQSKLLIAGTLTFFYKPQQVVVHLGVCAAVCAGLLIYSYKTAPCLVESYNYWKTWAYTIPLWTMACGVFNYYSEAQLAAFCFLTGGNVVVVVILITVRFVTSSRRAKTSAVVQPSMQRLGEDENFIDSKAT